MPIEWKVKPQIEMEAEESLARYMRALGHPARVHLLRVLLQRGSAPCGELVSTLSLAQSTTSQHLKMLKASGLVEDEVQGPRRVYRARPDAIEQIRLFVAAL